MALQGKWTGSYTDIALLSDDERRAKKLSSTSTICEVIGWDRVGVKCGLAQMEEIVAYCKQQHVITVDTETGPRPQFDTDDRAALDPFKGKIVLCQIGDEARQYIVWWDTIGATAKELFRTEVWCNPEVRKVGVNLKFDCKMFLGNEGLHWRGEGLLDTQLIEQILCCGLTGEVGQTMKLTGMGMMAKRWLGLLLVKDEDIRTGWAAMTPGKWWRTAEEIFAMDNCSWDGAALQHEIEKEQGLKKLYYAADDLVIPIKLLKCQTPWVTRFELTETVKLEMAFLPELAEMEVHGLLLDWDRWMSLTADAETMLAEACEALDAIFDVEVSYSLDMAGTLTVTRDKNYSSKEQLKKLIHDYMWNTHGVTVIGTNQQLHDALVRGGLNPARLAHVFEPRLVPNPKNPAKNKQVAYPDACDLIEGSDVVDSLWDYYSGKLPDGAFALPSTDSKILKLLKIIWEADKDTLDVRAPLPSYIGLPPELIDPLLKHREASTKLSRYGRNWAALINPVTGRVHTDTTQCAMDTARLSTRPNYQNIPSKQIWRDPFRAREGYQIVGSDAGQEEPRIIAELSHAPVYMRVFWSAHPGTAGFAYWCSEQFGPPVTETLDLYGAVGAASGILPPDGEKKSVAKLPENKPGRGKAKTVVLGLGYGTGPDKYHVGLCIDVGHYVPRAEADQYYNGFWAIVPEVKTTLDGLSDLCDPRRSKRKVWHFLVEANVTYSESLGGRKRFFDPAAPNTYTVGRNHPIQTTGADILKAVVVYTMAEGRRRQLDARILLTAHDELLGEARTDHASEFGLLQEEAWHEVGKRYLKYVPLLAEHYVADCWTKD